MKNKNNSFSVGNNEKHEVSLKYDHWWGRFYIYVDGKETTINGKSVITGSFSIEVGNEEKHTITFQIILSVFFAAFRKKEVQVLIDGKLFDTFEL
ncbi:hypothetical protein COY14_01580 [Candidatus Roizmanbacteria bacterium CG_4_10_14_0_2_um_filter_36_9]|uniref:Uncharacterized protein n=1 Tax=Candidatus Roizmanbacteria bacterium CG_4_10_14_0_2_um_filter_36_9 TaxID=1974823 RepID=A0A2M7U580_9BACT|nr:MAG: hypothetical protein COY14_01580 [Candidatus Roizmanbacteria bacterium CG_4_10_14_0_2_um_filter_36_9]